MRLIDRKQPPKALANLLQTEPDIFTLPNGLTVVYQHVPTHPLFSAQVWVRTGSIHEEHHCGSGLSHFLEHMMFQGSENRRPGEIAERVQTFGGQINAYTSFDRTVYYIDGPSEAFALAAQLLYDLTLTATIGDAEWTRERDVILREIDMTLDDPDRTLSRSLFATAYREHPFCHPVIGHRTLFEQVTPEILRNYYYRRYQPANMVVSVVGAITRSQLDKALAASFAKAPRKFLAPVLINHEPDQIAYRERTLYSDCTITRGLLGFKIPGMRSPKSVGLDVCAAIMGAGHSGRLRQKLRDELGLVHYIGATAWNPGEPGLFWIAYHADPAVAEAAESAILETCESYTSACFDTDELEKAKRFALYSEVQSRQTVSGLASRLGLTTALVGDPGYPQRYFHELEQLSLEDLRVIASETFVPQRLSSVTMQPVSRRINGRKRHKAKPIADFKEEQLSNGARIIWQRDPRLPRIGLSLRSLGGPAYEPQGKEGITSLLSTLLTKDTRHHSAREIARIMENNGGFFYEGSGNNSFHLSMDMMPDFCSHGIDLLQQAILEPAFNETTFARERSAQIAALCEQKDEVLDVARTSMRRHFFAPHPLAHDPLGNIAAVESINPADIRAHYQRLITGSNTVMVATGDFDPDKLLPKLSHFLCQLPNSDFTIANADFRPQFCHEPVVEHMQREQAIVIDTYAVPGFLADSNIILEILNELLSDMSGPLFQHVREQKSLAYFVGTKPMQAMHCGGFFLYAGTHPNQHHAVFAAFDHEMERLLKGDIRGDQIEAARTRLKVESRFSLQTAAGRGAQAGLNALFGRPIMNWLHYEAKLDAVTLPQIQAFAEKYFQPHQRLRYCLMPS